MAQWRTIPSCRIYRDQSNPARQTGGAVLQAAGNGGAVDQGRQERRQMDEAVLSRLCGQSSAAAPVRAGLQSGQLPAAGGAAASGAALDIDDVAGETDQDWCEGRAPFPADRLPDGGGGGAERVVPDDFGTDWTVEITSSSNRMRKSGRNHMKTTATTEAVSSPPEENEFWNTNRRRNTTCAGQKPRSDWKNDLQTYEEGRKSRKPPTPFVGIKPYGKSQFKTETQIKEGNI